MSSSALSSAFEKLFITSSLMFSLAVVLLPGEAGAQVPGKTNLILQARQVEQSGRLVEAERLYEQVLATDLTSQEAHHRLGVLAAQRGDLHRAITHFTTAEGLGVVTVQLLNDFGGTLFLKGDLVASEEKLRKALTIDPGNKQARDNLALVQDTRRKRAHAQSAALVRRIAEIRAEEENRAAHKAIADAQIAARVRKLAEARAASEARATTQQIARIRQSNPIDRNLPPARPATRQVQPSKPVVSQPSPSKPVVNGLPKSKPAAARPSPSKPVVSSHPLSKPVIKPIQPSKPAAKPVRVESKLRVKPNSQSSGRVAKADLIRVTKKPAQPTQATTPKRLVTRLPDFPPAIPTEQRSSRAARKPAVKDANKSKQAAQKPLPRKGNLVSLFKRPSTIKMVSGTRVDDDSATQATSASAEEGWRKAEALRQQGNTRGALEVIEEALRSQPKSARNLMTKARCLADQAEFAQAERILQSVKTSALAAPVERAQAMVILGQLSLESGSQDAAEAIKMYMQAINQVQNLPGKSDAATQRAAQDVLIEANLGVAHSIARGKWNKKSTAVPVWIGRAEQMVETKVEQAGGPRGLRLQVIESSLRAYSSFEPSISPQRHLQEAEALASEIKSKSKSSADNSQAQWQLGLIHVHAVKLACARKEFDLAYQYAQRAQGYLEKSVGGRSSSQRARHELGKAYYWIGTSSALASKDQEKAMDWYIRSVALIVSEGEKETFYPADTSSALINMGNAFWQAKLAQKAVDTTGEGARLIQQAVDLGSRDRRSLAQAYESLSGMHRRLGQTQQADAYAEKAASNRK